MANNKLNNIINYFRNKHIFYFYSNKSIENIYKEKLLILGEHFLYYESLKNVYFIKSQFVTMIQLTNWAKRSKQRYKRLKRHY